MDLQADRLAVPEPDVAAAPEGFLVEMVPGERIHFLDWGGPDTNAAPGRIGLLLIHGLNATAWAWTPVSRRVRRVSRTVAIDLRGHGLSDAPTAGYNEEQLAQDVIAVAEGSGLLAEPADRVVLVGHGFGAMVAAWAAGRLGSRCAGLVLVDGGWQDVAAETGMTPDEWLRGLDEPPEVLRSMSAFLADRRGFDPATWDPDQEQAARNTVVEVPAGKVVPAVRPHALAGSVEAMFGYHPSAALGDLDLPVVAVLAGGQDATDKKDALARLQLERQRHGLDPIRTLDLGDVGHTLMRYRPVEVSAAVLGALAPIGLAAAPGAGNQPAR
jgi:pimeloyl-ACP methyl ester carboxylesterase